MSCLKMPRSPLSLLTSSSKRKNTAAHDAHVPKYFMDGNPTSTSTFELGSNEDSYNDENMSLSSNWPSEESILASSNQNSTMNFSLSAPSSIVRNKIQACSTPKEQVSLTQDTSKSPFPAPKSFKMPESTPYSQALCETRRDIYRNGTRKIRNMNVNYPPRPGTENIRNIYYTNKTPNKHDGVYKANMEKCLEEQKKTARQEKLRLFREIGLESLLSLVVAIWQLFYVLDVIPNTDFICYSINIAVCISYGVAYMAPHPIMWGIVSCSFLVYMSFVWMFGATCAIGYFVYAAIFAKSVMTILQTMLVLAS